MALTCDEITAAIGPAGAGGKIRRMTTVELAEDAFLKEEHLKALSMMNTPQDFEARKKAFIELAEAKEAATLARLKLNERTDRP